MLWFKPVLAAFTIGAAAAQDSYGVPSTGSIGGRSNFAASGSNFGSGGSSFSSGGSNFGSGGSSFSSGSSSFSSGSSGFSGRSSGGSSFSSGGSSFSSGGSSFNSGGFNSGGSSFNSGGSSFNSGGSSFSSGGSSFSSGGSSFGGSGSRSGSGNGGVTGGIDFSQGTRRADGKICVTKQSNVETIAKDPILECIHKREEKCHYTYITKFEPAQEEVCEENFEKQCQITFKQQATTETVKKCYRPLQKVCNGQGPEECRTLYESSCTTRYIQKGPGKFVGDTSCEKLPIEICGAGCTTEEGPEECHDKEIASLVDVPEEVCDLNPQKTCRLQTKLVPRLEPKPECTIVPREVCNLKFSSPRKESKPLTSEWCLDPSAPIPDETYNESNAAGLPIGGINPRNFG